MSQSVVLVVEDDFSLREALCEILSGAGYEALAAADGEQAVRLLEEHDIHMVVTDVQMQPMDGHTLLKQIRAGHPEVPVVMITAYGTIEKAVSAMRDGAADYLVKPFEAHVLVETVKRLALPAAPSVGFVAEDPRSRQAVDLARRVAATEATVMISGESGTGKEVIARFIHANSPRAAGPFVAINCAAIPENMLEAVLFGYEKGAFTGAYQATPGKFEQAQRGTLLLDEISEMDMGLQAKLLRVLQEREVERLGGRKLISLDVRVLATSNRNLRDEVTAGRFREDLYYRLNVFPLRLTSLRERQADVLPLFKNLLERRCAGIQPVPRLSRDAEDVLLSHNWPGNVRELDNVVQRALILKAGHMITAEDIQFESVAAGSLSESNDCHAPARGTDERSSLGDGLKASEQRMILDALEAGNGSRKVAAEKLGISPRTLRYKLARMREQGIAIPG